MSQTTSEAICVEIGNPLEQEPLEVQYALAGLAYVTAALISVGHESVITNMSLYETVLDRINEGVTDSQTWSKLEVAHPMIGQLLDDTERYQTTEDFKKFLNLRGVFSNEVRLVAPDSERPNSFRLTFLNFG